MARLWLDGGHGRIAPPWMPFVAAPFMLISKLCFPQTWNCCKPKIMDVVCYFFAFRLILMSFCRQRQTRQYCITSTLVACFSWTIRHAVCRKQRSSRRRRSRIWSRSSIRQSASLSPFWRSISAWPSSVTLFRCRLSALGACNPPYSANATRTPATFCCLSSVIKFFLFTQRRRVVQTRVINHPSSLQ